MHDYVLAALLYERLSEIRELNLNKLFGAAYLWVALLSLPADVAGLPVVGEDDSIPRQVFVLRVKLLRGLAERGMLPVKLLKSRLEEVLLSTLNRIR
jgi:hypothetical protein